MTIIKLAYLIYLELLFEFVGSGLGEFGSLFGLLDVGFDENELTGNFFVLLVSLLGNGFGLLEGGLLVLESLLVLGSSSFNDLTASLGLIGILLGFIKL
jgi:hypothetical protein